MESKMRPNFRPFQIQHGDANSPIDRSHNYTRGGNTRVMNSRSVPRSGSSSPLPCADARDSGIGRDQTTTPNFYLARLDGALAPSSGRYSEAEPARGRVIYTRGRAKQRKRTRRDQPGQIKHLSCIGVSNPPPRQMHTRR